jgi:hypothetical protein
VKWKSTLNASSKANLADSECLAKSTTVSTNYDTLENLDTGTASFDNSNVYFYVIARAKIWDSSAQ